jgi:hypothetical protein
MFEYTGYRSNNETVTAPEVAYDFTVSVAGSACDPLIQANKNIVWALDANDDPTDDATEFKTWEGLMSDILRLSGANVVYAAPDPNGADEAARAGVVSATQSYSPGELPAAFDDKLSDGSSVAIETHTISWQWIFGSDETENTTKLYDANGYVGDVQTATMTQNQYDTYMANAAALDDVTIVITITATQVD